MGVESSSRRRFLHTIAIIAPAIFVAGALRVKPAEAEQGSPYNLKDRGVDANGNQLYGLTSMTVGNDPYGKDLMDQGTFPAVPPNPRMLTPWDNGVLEAHPESGLVHYRYSGPDTIKPYSILLNGYFPMTAPAVLGRNVYVAGRDGHNAFVLSEVSGLLDGNKESQVDIILPEGPHYLSTVVVNGSPQLVIGSNGEEGGKLYLPTTSHLQSGELGPSVTLPPGTHVEGAYYEDGLLRLYLRDTRGALKLYDMRLSDNSLYYNGPLDPNAQVFPTVRGAVLLDGEGSVATRIGPDGQITRTISPGPAKCAFATTEGLVVCTGMAPITLTPRTQIYLPNVTR